MKMKGILSISTRNLKRRLARTIVLMLTVSVVTGTLFSSTIFISGMKNALRIGTYRLGADVLVVPEKYEVQARTALLSGEPTSFLMDKEVLSRINKVEGVKGASAQLFLKPASFTCCYNVDAFLVAFDPETDFTVMPWLEENLKEPLTDSEVITGSNMPIIVGDTIPFFGTPFEVVGVMEPTGMKFFDQSVFMTMSAALKMAENSKTMSMQPVSIDENSISAVLVQVADDLTPERLAIRIEHAVDGVKAIASDEVISTVRKQLSGLMKSIIIIISILWATALLMMGFSFYMIVNERRRELGLLRAMGARKSQVFGMIMDEALIISAAGGVSGIATGACFIYLFNESIIRSLKLPYLLPNGQMLMELIASSLLFAVLTGFLASVLPAISASMKDPYDSIRKGE